MYYYVVQQHELSDVDTVMDFYGYEVLIGKLL
jgi:hypothetical protein